MLAVFASRRAPLEFRTQATEILAGLENEKEPMPITHYGKPVAYRVDAETYEDPQRST
jgi:PHD/YefM family antitoxin component YafN of YafNO toxin-antitoxin module